MNDRHGPGTNWDQICPQLGSKIRTDTTRVDIAPENPTHTLSMANPKIVTMIEIKVTQP
ncbi:MAG: hypothetical protein Fur0025_32190 [Oscillatoriaceae cyanobacterium]